MVRIFYVEDEPFLAKIVADTLRSSDYEIDHYVDGARALEAFESSKYDICILDIMLPKISGYEIAESIRKMNPQIPIIFLTAKDQTEDLVKGFKKGGNDYIKKPFSIEELIIRIENLITLVKIKAAGTDNLNKSIQIGSQYIFHPHRFLLEHNGHQKQLSHKENMILTLLCEHKNQVLQRKDLLIHAWGDDSFYNSRNLDVYITKLRNLLKKDESIRIRTLKGVGYQFVVE